MEGSLVGSFTQSSRWSLGEPNTYSRQEKVEPPPDPYTQTQVMKQRERERQERHDKRRQKYKERQEEIAEKARLEGIEEKLLEGFLTPETGRASLISENEEDNTAEGANLEGVAAAERLMTQSKKVGSHRACILCGCAF